MYRINNNNFKILIKYKEFMFVLDNILENIPRKDMYYKDKIRDISCCILHDIININYENNIDYIRNISISLKTNIALIDFMLERSYRKKYINEKALYKIGTLLVEINKVTNKWIDGVIEVGSKN